MRSVEYAFSCGTLHAALRSTERRKNDDDLVELGGELTVAVEA